MSRGWSIVDVVIICGQLFLAANETLLVVFSLPQIPERYEVFEELCVKLTRKFPSVVLPLPPKKPLIVNDSVLSERRRHMETVLALIAKVPKLACSSVVLEFLGAKRGHKQVNRLEETHKVRIFAN